MSTWNAVKYPDCQTWTVAAETSVASKIANEADAHLIAAAPELLEASRAVLLFHSGSSWDDAKQAEWQRLGLLLLGEPKFRDYHYARGSMTPTSFEATTRVLCDMVRAATAKAKQ